MKWRFLCSMLISVSLAACSTNEVVTTVQSGEAAAMLIMQTPTELHLPTETAIPVTTTEEVVPTVSGDPFDGWRIDDLANREYGGPGIKLGKEVEAGDGFRRWDMTYMSDGLLITGLVNYPPGVGPFPVIIVNHGYVNPARYESGADTWRIANWLARHGYITLMPDYRNHAGSDIGPNPFHIGYAIDIMNLAAQAHLLPQSNAGQIGMIGHSMGGEISMWPMVLSDEIDAVVLYASMSGDAALNWSYALEHWEVQRDAMRALAMVYGTPEEQPDGYAEISPVNYLDRVRMPVMIHHGYMDDVVPIAWSEGLADQLEGAEAEVTLYKYGGGGHTLTGENFTALMERTLELFETNVRGDVNHQADGE